jgi:ABC-type dipeptide/oligopeptide/nickel transport system ATPase subunit
MLLQIKDLKKYYHSGHDLVRAVDGVDLVVRQGESLGVVGPSGCGKTTLARLIMGLVPPDSGEILLDGHSRREAYRHIFCRKVRMVFQDPFASLDPRFTVRGILKEALVLEKAMPGAEAEARMRRVLEAVGLTEPVLDRFPDEFSGGERQRISIARALMTEPSLLILDEAVSALDVLIQKSILDMLAGLKVRLGLTYLFISHNIQAAARISQKIVVMDQGRVVEYGLIKDVLRRPGHPFTRQLLEAALSYKISAEEQGS